MSRPDPHQRNREARAAVLDALASGPRPFEQLRRALKAFGRYGTIAGADLLLATMAAEGAIEKRPFRLGPVTGTWALPAPAPQVASTLPPAPAGENRSVASRRPKG